VSSTLDSATKTVWNLRSRPGSFSNVLRTRLCSKPIARKSPRAELASSCRASSRPRCSRSTSVCSSSMNRRSALVLDLPERAFKRSFNSPQILVPATLHPDLGHRTFALKRLGDISWRRCAASDLQQMAVLPSRVTNQDRIILGAAQYTWTTRQISSSRTDDRVELAAAANSVRSRA